MTCDASGVLKSEIMGALLADELMRPLVLKALHAAKEQVCSVAICPDTADRSKEQPGASLWISSMNTRMWHSATFDGQEHEIVLRLMAHKATKPDQLDPYMQRVNRLLHDADLPLAGHALVQLEFECSETHSGCDGKPLYCDIAFRALTICD